MLARAPGDVTCANAAQVNAPHRQDVHPIQPGATGQCAQLRPERTRAADQRTRAADSAQISQRRAAGMRCAAGQLTERRADCAADSAHIWSTRSASMVDLRPGPARCAEPAGPRFPSVHAKTGPITGSTLCGSDRGHHRPSRFGIAVRPGAPQGPACGTGDAKRDRSRDGRGRGRGWSLAGSPRPNRAGAGGLSGTSGGGDGWVLRRQPGRTSPRPPSVSSFQESPGCPPGSSCATEPDTNATYGRYQPAASRWMPAGASLGTP